MDSLFTSIALFESLLEESIHSCGTIHHKRKDFPEELKDKKKLQLKKIFIVCLCVGGCMCMYTEV